ncbi:MAG TPA: hypothetical protein VFZ58_00030 [Candidatus Saccharimonadales bacterium]
MKPDVNKLLQKRMDRKDFLKHLGIGFAAITGVATVLKAVTSMTNSGTDAKAYGASVYGGAPHTGSNQKTS